VQCWMNYLTEERALSAAQLAVKLAEESASGRREV